MISDERKTPLSAISNRRAGWHAKSIAKALTTISDEKDRTIAASCAMMLASICHAAKAERMSVHAKHLDIGPVDTGSWLVTVEQTDPAGTPVEEIRENKGRFEFNGDVVGLWNRVSSSGQFILEALRILFLGRVAMVLHKAIPLTGMSVETKEGRHGHSRP